MKKVLSISLLCLMLVTTVGFSVSRHYCGNYLSSISLMGNGGCACDDNMENEGDCCRNEVDYFQLDEDYLVNSVVSSFENEYINVIFSNYIDLQFEETNTQTRFLRYKPPLIERDIPVLFQSFLS